MHELAARFGTYPPAGAWARLRWLPRALVDAGLRVGRANRMDVCFLQRELISTLLTWEPLIRVPYVFDVDDAIFLGRRGALTDRIARRAQMTICGNRYLAEHYSALGPVLVLPTAVDTDRFVPPDDDATDRPPVIGWSGSSSGLAYLYGIEEALRIVLRNHPRARLRVVCDQPPRFTSLPADRVEFEPWSAATEVASLQRFTVGLMPLEDSAWARGKCSFKMLTYMATGVPVVVSPVGMNNEVLSLGVCGYAACTRDEWVDAMNDLLRDAERACSMGRVGRGLVESQFSQRVVAPQLASVLMNAASSRSR